MEELLLRKYFFDSAADKSEKTVQLQGTYKVLFTSGEWLEHIPRTRYVVRCVIKLGYLTEFCISGRALLKHKKKYFSYFSM